MVEQASPAASAPEDKSSKAGHVESVLPVTATVPATPIATEKSMAATKRLATSSSKPNTKISSFFSVMKRASESTNNGHYFQPFCAKPNQTLAPINAFDCVARKRELWAAEANKNININDSNNRCFWSRGLVVPAYQRRARARCLGVDSNPVWLVVKLLQFHTNHRPAYFGTWQARNSMIRARRPFTQAADLDYEYDSDDDWGEDAEILDAESISGSEDGDDDEDTDMSELLDDEQSDSSVGRCCALWPIHALRIGWCRMDTFPRTREWASMPQSTKRGPKRRI